MDFSIAIIEWFSCLWWNLPKENSTIACNCEFKSFFFYFVFVWFSILICSLIEFERIVLFSIEPKSSDQNSMATSCQHGKTKWSEAQTGDSTFKFHRKLNFYLESVNIFGHDALSHCRAIHSGRENEMKKERESERTNERCDVWFRC